MTHDVLSELFDGQLQVIELPQGRPRGLADRLASLRGRIDGVTNQSVATILGRLRDGSTEILIVDGSNLGEVARATKRRFPGIRIVTLFHNVEARFFLGSLRATPGLHSLGVLVANFLAERKAVRASDALVCLTPRDRRQLKRFYGRAGTCVCPLAVRDVPRARAAPPGIEPGYLLFVGGGFYANRAGIQWFVDNVADRIPLPTFIVGRGLEDLRPMLQHSGRVRLVGEVDDLAAWYAGAKVVVAPIFDGSGMKTKVAEAMMFGKKIVGTPDAFAGYEAVADQVGRTCSTADEFAAALTSLEGFVDGPFDARVHALYEAHYSPAAFRARLGSILTAVSQ